jgi:hypothetical protein
METSYYYVVSSSKIAPNCVIYLHGNSSSRLEGIGILDNLL